MAAPNTFALRRVTALIGPYGSGKTELSIALAMHAAQQIAAKPNGLSKVVLADVDVLKPYFRSREAGDHLRKAGVDLISPCGALGNSDLPILTHELRGSVVRQDLQVLLDVGGDPVGARALGSISDVVGQGAHDLLLVLNRNRPFMDTLDGVVAQAHQIAAASHLDITGVISNTHMLDETSADEVRWGLDLSREVAHALGVDVRLLAIPDALASEFDGRPDLPPVVAIRRQMMPLFLGGVVLAGPTPSART